MAPIVAELHNRFQFPSPACLPACSLACLVAPRPPLLSAACLPACLAVGRTGADPSRPVPYSLFSQYTDQAEQEDPVVSWWTFLSSRGTLNSEDRRKVRPKVHFSLKFKGHSRHSTVTECHDGDEDANSSTKMMYGQICTKMTKQMPLPSVLSADL
ncbi:hypothetical protein INR49_023234%2C partial [Xyrichtys novacula]|uniref:Uncharacterized protein n=1 Tax=Xyrichtys novacula TaxID=13765 RepID=A0AAV1FZ13_XYRNO|nr:hypothetical protein INR49_023234%2C partial [Xyrichtys novacula]